MSTLSQFDSLLAEVQRMREEHLRLQEENERLKSLAAAAAAAAPAAAAPAAPAPAPATVGSKHVWSDRAGQRRVVAIQLKDGNVLQVKDISTDLCDYTKKFYDSLDLWLASLPQDCQLQTEASDGLTDLQWRLQQPFPKGADDCKSFKEFCGRWRIRDYSYERPSPEETLQQFKKCFHEDHARVAQINPTSDSFMSTTFSNLSIMMRLPRSYRKLIALQGHVNSLTSNERYRKPICTVTAGKARLYAFVNGERARITMGKYSAIGYMCCNGRKATTFADLGIDLKADGTPLLELSYRKNTYKL
jgi:hypothetical protein